MKQFLVALLPKIYGQLFNIIALLTKTRAAKFAFNIFCTIRKGRVLPHQRAFLDPARLAVERVGEHNIQTYQWKGAGTTVLLIHGWESNTYRWRNLIQKLQEQEFNIIALDAPGHGYSSGKHLHVPLYATATRHIMDKYQPNCIVAHSVGGMTTLFDHFQNPESSAEKIVTIGAPAEFSQIMDQYQGIVRFNNRVREAMNNYLKTWFGFYFHEFSSALFVKHNTKKGLLLHDTKDVQVPFAASENVHKHWKGSTLIATTGLGHSMHQESVNNDIIRFLKA